ncbi:MULTISPECIES: DUF1329 domain-containing protein [Pseudomonas]|uniref:DUF1329 domain-containing protein n=1 Tax=Pseudomonas TaxID=286 RepID=UPI000D0032ED|nr:MULTISPECIES: DUF1329 domain-containing protein [Pseudomonas]PRA46516.1 outer membrane lipoprotein-sorting protein [Pseudomonas sp. MYb115]QXN52412.1 DUF1329 domain-containing protein [Pseudomonas fluorescens]WSO26749.1 DUF1329 domain-containing protein [Pseudomonas fluorescens]
MTFIKTVLAASLAMVLAAQAQAAVSPQEAANLGSSLTQVGAEKAGNADGSIPAYSGGLTTPPASYKAGDSMRPDPFANEKPLLVIDGKNVDQYKNLLSATTVELAKRFPSFRVDVYPTHRTVSLPQAVLDNGVKNASGAKSLEGGLAIDNVLPGVPFPIPQSGNEAMWNFLLRYQGVSINSKYDSWNVDSAGVASLATTGQAFISYPIYENLTQPISSADVYYQMKLAYTGPARRAGEAIMLKDAANPLQQPRRAWQYLPGQRRVKLAPSLAYDTPNPGTAGAGTYDDVFVFNGALDRYDWKLVGKQEMIVPYNTYKLTYVQDPKSITTPNHLAPDFVRWEKHRVWVVEGTLKAGARHIYQKRRFYLDEDSWTALASDQYDARGQLYRGSFAFLSQSYDKQVPDSTPFMIYDLVGGAYNINGVVGPYGGIKYIDPLSKAQWSSESLAGSGIR